MKNINALHKELEGTLVGRIIACMEAGKFQYPFDEVKEKDIPLGDMTLYEKACATISAESKGLEAIDELSKDDKRKIRRLKNDSKQAEALLWSAIQERLHETEFARLGIRDGFKIVDQGKRTCPECAECKVVGCPGSMTDEYCGWP